MGGPVVVHGRVFEESVVVGIEEPGEFVEGFVPVDVHLPIHEGLRFGGVVQLNEAIVSSAIGESFAIHRFCKPFTTVHADLDGERQPALNAGVHEPKQGVHQIMIEGQAFAEPGNEFQLLDFSVAMNIETGAGFDARQDGDEAGGDSIPLGDPAGECFFVGVAGGQIFDRAPERLSRTQRGLFHFGGEAVGVGAEVFEKDLVSPEESFEPFDVGDRTQGPSENQSVKSAQNASDMFLMICYKTVHGVLRLKRNGFANNFYFIGDTVSIFRHLFGCGFVAL